MDDNHEILPSPQKKSPESAAHHPDAAPRGPHAAESEHAASKVMENPAFSGQPVQSTQPTGNDSSQLQATASVVPPATQATIDDFMTDAPQIADDVDLIEKEWVNKTKDIVQRTKDDPYNQNRQIVRLRADYMKKRYNKDIKLTKE
jgi:Rieske Fe-S protein